MQSKVQEKYDAPAIWHRFNQKYTHLVPGIADDKKARYQKKLSDESIAKSYDDSKIKATIRIQSRWRGVRSRYKLIHVNLKGNHHSDFNHLVGEQKIKRSFNSRKQDLLHQAIQVGNWDAEIFKDETLPQLAMSLFASSKITQQQIYSILERHQTIKEHEYLETYFILDSNNQFTSDAKELIQVIQALRYLKPLSEQQLENFRLLIMALPASERFFYTTSFSLQKKMDKFVYRLHGLDAVYLSSDKRRAFHLTSGSRDALGLARFGEHEYVRPMPRLGKLAVDDIEHGVTRSARYAALSYPETIAYGEGLHDWSEVDNFEATSHDLYHANVMSLIPNNLLKALQRFVSIVRQGTGSAWSKEIWDWVDGDYNYLLKQNKLNPHNINMTKLFCDLLFDRSTATSQGGYLMQIKTDNSSELFELTLPGAMIYLDMIENRSEWLELKIDPSWLELPFSQHYITIKSIYPLLQGDKKQIQIAKCMSYFACTQHSMFCPQYVFELIHEHGEHFSIHKWKKKDAPDPSLINTTYLAYKNQEFSTPQHVRQLIVEYCGYTEQSQIDHFCDAILQYGYAEKKARAYVAYRKMPSMSHWIQLHQDLIVYLALSIIGIGIILLLIAMAAIQVFIEQKTTRSPYAKVPTEDLDTKVHNVSEHGMFSKATRASESGKLTDNHLSTSIHESNSKDSLQL